MSIKQIYKLKKMHGEEQKLSLMADDECPTNINYSDFYWYILQG